MKSKKIKIILLSLITTIIVSLISFSAVSPVFANDVPACSLTYFINLEPTDGKYVVYYYVNADNLPTGTELLCQVSVEKDGGGFGASGNYFVTANGSYYNYFQFPISFPPGSYTTTLAIGTYTYDVDFGMAFLNEPPSCEDTVEFVIPPVSNIQVFPGCPGKPTGFILNATGYEGHPFFLEIMVPDGSGGWNQLDPGAQPPWIYEGDITSDPWTSSLMNYSLQAGHYKAVFHSEYWNDIFGGNILFDVAEKEFTVGPCQSAVPVWVRTLPMTCYRVWINEDGNFQFIFWYPYADNNWVRIYDMDGNMVYEADMPYDNPNLIVDLPDGMYTVKTFSDQPEPLQEFVIGKP